MTFVFAIALLLSRANTATRANPVMIFFMILSFECKTLQNKGFDWDFAILMVRQSFFLFRSDVFHKCYMCRVLLWRIIYMYMVTGDKYIAPKVEILDVVSSQVLCQSGAQSGEVEAVGRMEFGW